MLRWSIVYLMSTDPLDPKLLLLEETPLQVKAAQIIPGLGFLEPHNKSGDLGVNAKLDIPLWLVEQFTQKGLVTVDTPHFFGKHLTPLLERAPVQANLRVKHPRYFSLGARYASLVKILLCI
jgi:hypothetical protein